MLKTSIKDKGILKILNSHGVELTLSKKIQEEINVIPETISKSELKGREDFRDKLIITIDGDDTKDIDDAISIEMLENKNFYLGVHIADVTHYVREHSAIDRAALTQATSIYPVNGVVPMLPKELSNGICSLNPNVDRLSLSCFMEINYKGEVENYKICESVINSKYKMTYNIVNDIIENSNKELIKEYNEIYKMLLDLNKLTKILINKRNKRGSLDFNCPETKFICDSNDRILSVKEYDRNSATRLIEECMIVCNETIATHCFEKKLPFLYRIHDKPSEEKMENLQEYLITAGYTLKNQKVRSIQKLLKEVEGTPSEKGINYLLLRSLAKAIYSAENEDHFALASQYYCHFTSPIRRYPDLQIHRIIKADLNNKLGYKELKVFRSIVNTIDTHCSNMEQAAQKIERETVKLKSAEYMLDKIGEGYKGVITGINEQGFYVQLENTIEGFVNIYSIKDDKYTFDEYKLCFVGEKTRKIFVLGQNVDIIVKNVNIENYQIDFKLNDID